MLSIYGIYFRYTHDSVYFVLDDAVASYPRITGYATSTIVLSIAIRVAFWRPLEKQGKAEWIKY